VTGGARLVGEVPVVGAKNSVLKLMAAALLAPGETTIGNLPEISDVGIMRQLLERLGCEVTQAPNGRTDEVLICVPEVPRH
jgi:UDP-N-acetylglucosamine 1-carboxyvinyltransferase